SAQTRARGNYSGGFWRLYPRSRRSCFVRWFGCGRFTACNAEEQVAQFGDLHLHAAERLARLGRFPVLNRLLQFDRERMLLLDELGRQSCSSAAAEPTIATRA